MSQSFDILDQQGRLKRFGISLLLATAAGVGALVVANRIIEPQSRVVYTRFGGDGSFVVMCGFFAFVAAYLGCQWLLKRAARRRNFAVARQHSDSDALRESADTIAASLDDRDSR